MLYSELRDRFVIKYKLECLKRGVKEIGLTDTIIADLIAEAQHSIALRCKDVESSLTISIVAGISKYILPKNYGGLKGKPLLNGFPLSVINKTDLETSDNYLGQSGCAIYNTPDGYTLLISPMPGSAATLVMSYYTLPGYYSGSVSSSFPGYDGKSFSGSVQLDDKYIDAIILYMLSQFFDEIIMKYDAELNRLKGNQLNTLNDTLDYNMGGIK